MHGLFGWGPHREDTNPLEDNTLQFLNVVQRQGIWETLYSVCCMWVNKSCRFVQSRTGFSLINFKSYISSKKAYFDEKHISMSPFPSLTLTNAALRVSRSWGPILCYASRGPALVAVSIASHKNARKWINLEVAWLCFLILNGMNKRIHEMNICM